MAVAFVKSYPGGVQSNKNLGSAWGYHYPGANPNNTAGNVFVLVMEFDNAAGAATPTVTSITKPVGETNDWVFLGAARYPSAGTAGAFSSGEMWAIKTTMVWPLEGRNVNLSTAVTQKANLTLEFSGVEVVQRSTAGSSYSTTTTAASAATTGTTPVIGDLALGFLFGSNIAVAPAGDTDTTGGSWSTRVDVGSTGGSGATNNYGIFQYKILTAASHQTYNNSAAMTAGNGAIVAILQATPDPAITQAAYRFYEDGTETGSVALAAQDTAPEVDTSSGDVNAQLRMRLQETNGGAVPASTDWQLQWEKNTSGTWTNVAGAGTTAIPYDSPNLTDGAATTNRLGSVGSDALCDGYDETNVDSDIGYASNLAYGQSFTGNGGKLARAGFMLRKINSPTATIVAQLYAHDGGTFGSTGKPTGSPLATSTTVLPVSSLGTTAAWVDFDFDRTYTLGNGTKYFITATVNLSDSVNYPNIAVDGTPTHPGNRVIQSSGSTWTASTFTDVIFRVYTAAPTFVAGKVSEDGLVDDLGWTASNFTEVLYSLTLKQADLAPSDSLRFRVLKNGATTDLTYTSYPSVTIGAGGPATHNAVVALTAAGSLTTAAYRERVATVALSATSTLTVAATIIPPAVTVEATAALSATSTLTATAFEQAQGAVSLFAASTLTTTAIRFGVLQATVPLTATATLTATAVRQPQASVSLVAGSTLTVAAVRSAEATASLSATSTLTAAATVTGAPVITAAVALTGVSALSVSATVTAAPVITATVALVASSTLTATGVREPQAAVSLVSASTLNATAERVRPAVVSLSATSTLSATGVPVRAAAVPLAAASTLTVTGVRASVATVALTASSTLTAAAVREPQGAVSLTATSTLTATGLRASYPTVGLVAASTLTVAAVPVRPAAVPLTATSTLTVTAIAIGASAGVAALIATSTLTTAATRTTYGTVSLTATALLTVQGVRVRPIAVSLTATSTLTATPTRIRPAVVPLTSTATLTITAVRSAGTAVGMVATATLVAVATTDSLAAVLRDVARTGYLHALDTDMHWYPVTTAP